MSKNKPVLGDSVKNLTLASMFLAVGIILPFLTGQIPQISSVLLPMHIPVFLCSLICTWRYGAAIGFILPILRSVMFGMPVMIPMAISMSFELLTYGIVAGVLYKLSRWQCVRALCRCLVVAMFLGRIVFGIVYMIIVGVSGGIFNLQVFLSSVFLTAIPGIVVQLILIPVIMVVLDRCKLVSFRKMTTAKKGERHI